MATRTTSSSKKTTSKKKAASTASEKAAAKKTTVSKKAAGKKTATKPASKKTAGKKTTTKKASSKKTVSKKTTAKKTATKKAATKKTAAKKARVGKQVESSVVELAITREEGRYALPSSVEVDLPKNYHPGEDEEYMGPQQLAYFRAKLRDWRAQLVEESRQTIDNLRGEVRDVGDEAERATRETENSLELRTRDRYRKLIAKIDKALRRIENGSYGFCEETDEEIGLRRLDARPIATLSLDAQERREHLRKQMGD